MDQTLTGTVYASSPAAVQHALSTGAIDGVVVVVPTDWVPDNDGELLTDLAAAVAEGQAPLAAYSNVRLRDSGTIIQAPAWSPERLRHHDYVSGPVAIHVGRWRESCREPDWTQSVWHLDLLLSLVEANAIVVQLPVPIGIRGAEFRSDHELDSAREVVSLHLARMGVSADVSVDYERKCLVFRHHPRPDLKVSIIVPTRGASGSVGDEQVVFITRLVNQIEGHSYTVDYDWVIVADVTDDMEYLSELRTLLGDRLTLVPYDRPFNFSEKINLGVLATKSPIIAILNDDMGVVSLNWLDQLVGLAAQSDVGEVGAVLAYPDDTVQCACHIYHHNQAYHGYVGFPLGDRAPLDLVIDREVSGLTGACIVQRREVWWEVGGWSEIFPGSFNDVDYCLKIRMSGYRIVSAGSCILHHHESQTRDPKVLSGEVSNLYERWQENLRVERYTFQPALRDFISTVSSANISQATRIL